MLLKNSGRDSRKGEKLKPRWKDSYTIHADLGKGVDTVCIETIGKKAVNISSLTEYYQSLL